MCLAEYGRIWRDIDKRPVINDLTNSKGGLHLQMSINIIILTLLIIFFNQVFVQFVFHNVQSGSLKDFFRFECSSQFVSAQWHCFALGHLVVAKI